MRAARMASARVLICCSPNMSFRRSAFPGNFRKFLEISGGRRSAVGGRLRSAVGLPPPEVKFPWKFLDSCFLSRGQISKRISRNLGLSQSARRNQKEPSFALHRQVTAGDVIEQDQSARVFRGENEQDRTRTYNLPIRGRMPCPLGHMPKKESLSYRNNTTYNQFF